MPILKLVRTWVVFEPKNEDDDESHRQQSHHHAHQNPEDGRELERHRTFWENQVEKNGVLVRRIVYAILLLQSCSSNYETLFLTQGPRDGYFKESFFHLNLSHSNSCDSSSSRSSTWKLR